MQIVGCRLYDSSPLQQEINTESQEEMNILDIMEYLEQTYPQRTGSIVDTNDNNKQQTKKIWKKTRNYLYQYRASLSSSITTKSRRRRDPLSLTNIQSIVSFLQSTFPHNPELQAKIIQESPRLLGQYKNINSRLIPTIEFLKGLYDNMGSSDGLFIEAISRNTNLLLIQGVGYTTTTTATNDDASSGDDNMIKVEEYLQQELDMKSSAVDKLKQNHPRIFQLSLIEKVQPVVNFLYKTLAAEKHDISTASQSKLKKQITKIITNQPMLLQLDVSTNLEPTVNYLRSACDLTEKELSTIILATPSLLGFSIDDNLRPTLQFLQDILTDSMKQSKDGGSDEEVSEESSKMLLRKCILKHPSVLALSIDNLHAKRDYFNSIGIEKRQSLAKRILTSAPSVYSLSLENNIIPKIEYLATLWGDNGSSQNDNKRSFLLDNIYEYPHVLTLSMEDNINPTISFYNMTGYVKEGNNIRGRYIATSLYNRLLPRWHFLIQEQEKQQQYELEQLESLVNSRSSIKSVKYNIPTSTTATSSSSTMTILPPLHLLAGANDENFCKQMRVSLDEYVTFKEEAVQRLKFSSQFDMWLKTGRPIDLTTTT